MTRNDQRSSQIRDQDSTLAIAMKEMKGTLVVMEEEDMEDVVVIVTSSFRRHAIPEIEEYSKKCR